MARSLMRHSVCDEAGNALQNALVRVYLEGTTTPVSDMYAAASGGSTIATLTSNAQGEVSAWFTTPKNVDLAVTDNSNAAYYPSAPTRALDWSNFTETVPVAADPGWIVQTVNAHGGLPATGGGAVPANMGFDTFFRGDRALDGDTAPSGQVYAKKGTLAPYLRDHTYRAAGAVDTPEHGVSTPVTLVNSGDTVTLASHGYGNGKVIRFSALVAGSGLTVGTTYYTYGITSATPNSFQLSLSNSGGPAVAINANGAATIGPPDGGYSFIQANHATAPTTISGECVFVASTAVSPTSNQEFVLLSSAVKPDLSTQSVQCSVRPDGFAVFKYVGGTGRVYAANESWAANLVEDGATRYSVSMSIDMATSTVTVSLPDGSVRSYTDADYALYWSTLASFQLLRTNAGNSGDVYCTGWTTTGAAVVLPESTAPPRVLDFSGDTATYLSTPSPRLSSDWIPGDLEVVVYATPDSWASTATQVIASQWKTNQQSWYVGLSASGNKLNAGISVLGNESSGTLLQSTAHPGVNSVGMWLRWRYVAATGVMSFYYSLDASTTAAGSVTWTALGSDTLAIPGPPFNSSAEWRIGNRQTTSTLPFAGIFYFAAVYDGIGGSFLGGVDLRETWSGTDDAENTWVLHGNGASYIQLSSSVLGLDTALAAKVATASLIILYRASDDTGSLDTTLADDDTLQFAIAANEVWFVEYELALDGSTTGDAKMQLTGPTGCTGRFRTSRLATTAASATTAPIGDDIAVGDTFTHGCVGAGTPTRATIRGIVTNGSTAGTVKLRKAQNSLDGAVATHLLNLSCLRATKRAA